MPLIFRALSYARQSLYNDCEGCSTMGYVHLTVGSVSLELGAFNKAVDSFQRAHKTAQSTQDNALLLQVRLVTRSARLRRLLQYKNSFV